MPEPPVHLSTRGGLPTGPVRVLCHRRWSRVVSIRRGRGADERPDIPVDWPAVSLIARQHWRLGLLEGVYDGRAVREPAYRTLSVGEALELAPQLESLLAEDDATWARHAVFGERLHDLMRLAVLPGAETAALVAERVPAQPALLLTLALMHRRRPEVVTPHADRIRAVLAGLTPEQRVRHAAEAADVAWSVLDDRDLALDLLAGWQDPLHAEEAGHHGVDALALPEELVSAHVAAADAGAPVARALVKHHLLGPLADELDLAEAVPLPPAFRGGLPVVERPLRLPGALVAQFAGWERLGGALVRVEARAGVDRMPTIGERPPDPRGVQAVVFVVNGGEQALAVEAAARKLDVPAQSAVRMDLGAVSDEVLVPRAPYRVEVTVRVGRESRSFALSGEVAVSC